MRPRLGLAALVAVAAAMGAPAAARADGGTLVVFWAPPEAPPEVARTRAALAARASRGGAAFVDASPAAPAAPRAPRRHRELIESYEALRFDAVVALAGETIAELDATGAAGLERGELSDVFLYRALALTQLGDQARAWDDLVRAATIDPARVLDPLRFPSRAVEAFVRARERVAAAPPAKLTIESPAGCALIVDGTPAASPVDVPPGEHWVRVVCAGLPAWGTRVNVGAAGATVRAAPVAPAPPDEPALAALGRTHRAARVVAAVVTIAAGAPPVLAVGSSGPGAGPARRVALTGAPAAVADAEAALDAELVPPGARDLGGPVKPAPASGWRSPWLWAAGGALVAAAILVPAFLLADDDGGRAGELVVRPEGLPW